MSKMQLKNFPETIDENDIDQFLVLVRQLCAEQERQHAEMLNLEVFQEVQEAEESVYGEEMNELSVLKGEVINKLFLAKTAEDFTQINNELALRINSITANLNLDI